VATTPADARGGFGPGIGFGIAAGALAAGAYGPYGYGYGPGYGYYGPRYYGPVYGRPAYYGGPDITGNIAAGKGELVRRSGASLRTSRPSVNRAPSLGRGALLCAPAPDRPAL
jgi:hypothetical protein